MEFREHNTYVCLPIKYKILEDWNLLSILVLWKTWYNWSHYNRGPVILDFTPFFQYYFNNENRWSGPFVKLLALAPTFNGEPLSLRKLDDFSFYCRLNRRQLSWFLQSYRYYTTRHTGFTWTCMIVPYYY